VKTILILLALIIGSEASISRPCTTSVINAKLYYKSNALDQPCSLSFDVRVSSIARIGRIHVKRAGVTWRSYVEAVGDTFIWDAPKTDTFHFASPQGRLVIFGGMWSWMDSWLRDTVINNKTYKINTESFFQGGIISSSTSYEDLYNDSTLYGTLNSKSGRDTLVKAMPPIIIELCTLKVSAVESPKPITTPNKSLPVKVFDALGRPVRGDISRMPHGIYFVLDGRKCIKKLNLK
jgi:hypothetical protein